MAGSNYSLAINSPCSQCTVCQAPNQYSIAACTVGANARCGTCLGGSYTLTVTGGSGVAGPTNNTICACGANFGSLGGNPVGCRCPAGAVTNAQNSVCSLCPINTFNAVVNTTAACLACPMGD